MNCPRCGAELVEHVPNIEWNRHWTCHDCESAWKLADGALTEGRSRPEAWKEFHETAAR